MANILDATAIEYTTKKEAGYFIQAMKKSYTLANGYVRVLPNVTKDVFVKKLVMTDQTVSQVDNRDCAWSPSERFSIDGKTMSVKNFKINEEQCLEELDNLYSEMVYNSYGATKTEFPSINGENADGKFGLEEGLMFMIQNSLGQDIENLIWGTKAVAGVKDGFVDKALASSDSVKINGVTLNASNVLTEIQKVYDAIPEAVLNDGAYEPTKAVVRIFVSPQTLRYVKQALSSTPTDYQVTLPSWTINGNSVYYMGVEIVAVGIANDTMLAASKDNLVFMTDLLSDTQSIRAKMGNDLKDESMWYVKGAYRAGVDFIFDDEVVVYSK